MMKQYEEIIVNRYCNLRDQHVTHFVKNQIFHPTGNTSPVKAPVKIVCANLQLAICSECECVVGRFGKKYYE